MTHHHQQPMTSSSTFRKTFIPHCDKIKYLGIDLITCRIFKCSYDNAKRKFYRAFNAVFGKIGKYLPVLYYGLEVCLINRDQVRSLDYAVQSCFRKIFTTRDHSVVEQCMIFFECHPVHGTVREKIRKFLEKLLMSSNQLYVLFKDKAAADLSN